MTINENNHQIGIGIILRYSHGSIIASINKVMMFCADPLIAKAQGLLTVACFYQYLEFYSVFFESDSSQVACDTKSKDSNSRKIGSLIAKFLDFNSKLS